MSRWMLEAAHAISGLRWRPSQPAVLWLGRDGVLALRPDPYGPDALPGRGAAAARAGLASETARIAQAAERASAASAAHPDFSAWCAANRGLSCRVLLSAECLAVITAEPALGLKRRLELIEHARTQFEQYHGADYQPAGTEPWPVLPWRSASGAGATALRAPSLASLQAAAQAHGVKLLSVQPAWAALAPLLLQQDPQTRSDEVLANPSGSGRTLMLLDEGRVVTAIVSNDGRPERVAFRRKPADPEQQAAWQAELCAEWGLHRTTEAPATGLPPVQVLHLPAAAQGLQGLAHLRPTAAEDFLDAERPKRLPKLAAATAMLVAAVAGIDAHGAWQQAQAAQTALAEARQVPQPPADIRDALTRQTEQRLQADLSRPWHAVFAATEASTQAGLQWLLMDHTAGAAGTAGSNWRAEGSSSTERSAERTARSEAESRSAATSDLRLEAQAPDLASAWRAAAALQAQPGVRQALLTHVRTETQGVRFELRAEWSDTDATATGTATTIATATKTASANEIAPVPMTPRATP